MQYVERSAPVASACYTLLERYDILVSTSAGSPLAAVGRDPIVNKAIELAISAIDELETCCGEARARA